MEASTLVAVGTLVAVIFGGLFAAIKNNERKVENLAERIDRQTLERFDCLKQELILRIDLALAQLDRKRSHQ